MRKSRFHLSAPAYFLCVALVTALGFGGAMLLRPGLKNTVQSALGLNKPLQTLPGSFYTVRVAPLFEANCTGCHGDRRQKGKLRLDTLDDVMRGGRSGAVVEARNTKGSELIRRITLPASSDKAMPPDGKTPLSADDIKVIELWVAAGASGRVLVGDIKGAPPPAKKIEFEEINPAIVEQQRAKLAATVKQLQKRFPKLAIAYESRGSADIEVNASFMKDEFGDAELAALVPLCDRLVWADFSGTSVSDASASSVGAMKRLRVLRLTNTKVTDKVVQALVPVNTLKLLTVVNTAVTQASLAQLRSKGVKVYDGNVSEGSPNADRKS